MMIIIMQTYLPFTVAFLTINTTVNIGNGWCNVFCNAFC